MGNWLERNKAVVVGLLALLSAVLGGFFFYANRSEPPPLEILTPEPTLSPTVIAEVEPPTPTPAPTNTPPPLRVYISGEVNSPDVYILPPESIIKDAIIAAGGATEKADLDVVNQAEELKDQQHIHIPAQEEARPTPPVSSGGRDPLPTSNLDARSSALQVAPQSGRKININTANTAELELLPGIGPSFAKRIVEYRETEGDFSAIEDITNVKGIGPATFEELKDYITVD